MKADRTTCSKPPARHERRDLPFGRRRHGPKRVEIRKCSGEACRNEGEKKAGLRHAGGADARAVEAHMADLVRDDLAQSLFDRVAELRVVAKDDAALLEH